MQSKCVDRYILKISMCTLFIIFVTVLCCKAVYAIDNHVNPYEIHLKSRHFTPSEGWKGAVSALAAEVGTQERIHVLMQFHYKPDAATREMLSEAGVKLLNYIPNHCWFASIPVGLDPNLSALSTVRWVGKILPEDKLSQALLDAVQGDRTLCSRWQNFAER